MSNFTLCVQIPGEWGQYLRTTVVIVVVLVLSALGMEVQFP
ncbi:hypothetical protein [Planomonospora venezuelensis]|uniref:Uncharacterized protein n=1 Tax=Planomonospora venezuelensis TaxID=1999 RepID=A0A841CSS6_PLAVE|nr:hypothetical protein [Planomonospora venezuelensis]MBB5960851.1 hypothetical protein [Planomonospora venezuelensis]GIN01085.1 hypothetical protein Pve01_27430 [Planomonospora venezuelensis]